MATASAPALVARRATPALPNLLPLLLIAAVLVSWMLGRLWASWGIGAFGACFILLKGRSDERLLLIGFVALSVIAGGEQMSIGLRGVLFFATFVALARYVEINPWLHLGMQVAALTVATLEALDAPVEVFVFGPSMLLLILATEVLRAPNGVPSPRRKAVAVIFNLLAFAISGLGFGSRSALFVWLAVNARRLNPIYFLIIGGLVLSAVPVLLALDNLPIFQKLGNSVTEVAEPIDPETGIVSQRGYENILFLGYITTASFKEIVLGSETPIFLDGGPLGQDDDVHFIPHNQIFGVIFQYGVLGLGLLLFYLVRLCKYLGADPYCGFFMVMLLLAGFVLKAGVYDGNLALLAATLNWIRNRHLKMQMLVVR